MKAQRILLLSAIILFVSVGDAIATPVTSVTIAGSLQSELGCPGDWQPDCAVTHLAYDAEDDVWQGTFSIPAGNWEYKAALNDSWDESYPASNLALNLASNVDVKFYYDDKTHWITDNINSLIVTAAGNFQDELGCSGDWQPWCLRSWLQDPDGDGLYSFVTDLIPVGSYEFKAALNEDWNESYPGSNVPFTISNSGDLATFTYSSSTNEVTISVTPPSLVPEPTTLVLMVLGLAGIGYRRKNTA